MTPEDRALLAEVDLLVRAVEGDDAELEGALDAALALGLVDPAWHAALLALRTPPQADPGERERLLARLEELVPQEDDREEIELFDAAVRALVEVGALTPGEARLWLVRVYGEEDEDCVDDEPLHALRGVVGGPTPWHDDFRVLSAECFDGGTLVRWQHVHPLAEGETFPSASFRASVVDDVGTAYECHGGAGSGHPEGPGAWRTTGSTVARPGLPPGARTLTVELGGVRATLDVAGIGERPAV